MERAITFFISDSKFAQMPAINMVMAEINRSAELNQGNILRSGENRINKKTPAVTSVEEWTRADTGVGAAIAAGSHLEKGICALLVMAAKRTQKTSTGEK